ncbi:MAG: hypothetical protein ACQUHE_06165 [Bacteroidia bacterium]
MRLTLRSFALLDLLSIGFMGMQVWNIATNFEQYASKLSDKVQAIMMFPMFILVIIGMIGLFLIKKFGLILYYIQFPFRLYLWVLSVGFITLIPAGLGNFEDKWFDILLKVCYVVEFIRLYLTIRIHTRIFKR